MAALHMVREMTCSAASGEGMAGSQRGGRGGEAARWWGRMDAGRVIGDADMSTTMPEGSARLVEEVGCLWRALQALDAPSSQHMRKGMRREAQADDSGLAAATALGRARRGAAACTDEVVRREEEVKREQALAVGKVAGLADEYRTRREQEDAASMAQVSACKR